jgi:hypothetical protein
MEDLDRRHEPFLLSAELPPINDRYAARRGAFATRGTGRAMVVKVRLDFLPTGCEAISFIKIIQSEADQQIGRHKVPLLTGVQRHLEKDGSPIFFGLMV